MFPTETPEAHGQVSYSHPMTSRNEQINQKRNNHPSLIYLCKPIKKTMARSPSLFATSIRLFFMTHPCKHPGGHFNKQGKQRLARLMQCLRFAHLSPAIPLLIPKLSSQRWASASVGMPIHWNKPVSIGLATTDNWLYAEKHQNMIPDSNAVLPKTGYFCLIVQCVCTECVGDRIIKKTSSPRIVQSDCDFCRVVAFFRWNWGV